MARSADRNRRCLALPLLAWLNAAGACVHTRPPPPAPAHPAPPAPAPPAAIVAERPASAGALPTTPSSSELSLHTSGRLHEPSSVGELAGAIRPASGIAPDVAGSERHVTPAAPPTRGQEAGAGVEGPREASTMDSNMPGRVNELLACRVEIAADRHVPVRRVLAGKLLARWTVRPGGAVEDPEVVALGPTDPEVLACIKRKLAGWSFNYPLGGRAVRLQQRLAFGRW